MSHCYQVPVALRPNAPLVFDAAWYVLSKTLAEEAATKVSKDNGIDMVTINPSMVIGPLLQPTLNTSSIAIQKLINGAQCQLIKFQRRGLRVWASTTFHLRRASKRLSKACKRRGLLVSKNNSACVKVKGSLLSEKRKEKLSSGCKIKVHCHYVL